MGELIAELRQMGVGEDEMPSVRTLEDWQQEGLITTERIWPGGGGSVSSYPSETAAKVFELIAILKRRRSFDWARMALFYRGFTVELEKLRNSYLTVVDSLIEAGSTTSDREIHQAAERTAGQHRRASQRHLLKRFEGSPEAVLASVFRNLVNLLLDRGPESMTSEDLDELVDAHGMVPELWAKLSEEEIDSFEDKLDLTWIRRSIEGLSEDDLTAARSRLFEFLDQSGLSYREHEEGFAPILPVMVLFQVDRPPPD